jgi:hypothetical protein
MLSLSLIARPMHRNAAYLVAGPIGRNHGPFPAEIGRPYDAHSVACVETGKRAEARVPAPNPLSVAILGGCLMPAGVQSPRR